MTPLQELVLNRMSELDLSFREAAAKTGGIMSHATLNKVALGLHSGNYAEDTLRGIALALDLPQSEVRKAAGLPPTAPSEFRLPAKANKLGPKDRKAILMMVEALLDEGEDRTG